MIIILTWIWAIGFVIAFVGLYCGPIYDPYRPIKSVLFKSVFWFFVIPVEAVKMLLSC